MTGLPLKRILYTANDLRHDSILVCLDAGVDFLLLHILLFFIVWQH